MNAKFLLATLLCLGVLAGAGGWMLLATHETSRAKAVAGPAIAPATVSAVPALMRSWQTRLKATGEVRAVQGADLSAEVSGIVDGIMFASGQDVAAGTVLLRLRPNDDDAKLAQLQAAADLAASNLARDRRQFDAQAVSRAALDADQSNLRADQAQVAAQRAQMAEKIIRAPFSGRLGIRMVDVGQYLNAGTPVVTLQALDPIYVDFNIQQQALGQLAVGQAVDVRVDAWPGRHFAARITSINSKIDSASRMVLVRAQLDNHDHALLPGMFAVVEVLAGAPQDRLTVPQTAISFNPYGDLVYVLARNRTGGLVAQSRVVQAGPVRGNQVSILSGIKPGERVVTAGQVKLRNGSPVIVDNRVQPLDTPQPSVQDE